MPDATRAPETGRDHRELPEWRLDDLYPGPESAALEAAVAGATSDAATFAKDFEGKLAGASGPRLAVAVARYEAIDEVLSCLMSYAHLHYAADMTAPGAGQFLQTLSERINDISAKLLFFTLELNRIPDEALARKLESPALGRYGPWLDEVRAFRPHQLSDEAERLLHDKSVAGRAAWMRLFDETIAGLRFEVGGRSLSSTEVLDLLSDPERDARKAAALEIGRVFGANARLFALVTNTLAKDKEVEDRWRHFARPVSSRNLANRVEDEVVEALVTAVRDSFAPLAHRYYALKARWMGADRLDYWDRNAPLPEDSDRAFGWADARETVLGAYGGFSPTLAEIGTRFFDDGWIDAPVRPGKAPGAFSHPTVPSAHPYILLNYQGKARDVMTLAHELGHGVHQVLAAGQGHLLAETPLTLAETASVFGEMLTFRALLAAEAEPGRRRILLAGKVEDMLNTVVRQVAFHEFERRVHDERRAGELAPERLGEIWIEVQTESLGPALRFDEGYASYWSYIPHFIHAPFYVYAYAFGDCLVNSLYATYEASPEGFEAKYLDMLRAGGSLRHQALLAPFGLDASDPDFWKRGLGIISGFVDQLAADG